MDIPSDGEARLREVVNLVNETLPVLRRMLKQHRDTLPEAVFSRLEQQAKLQDRLLGLALHTLSNLPDDPDERAITLRNTLEQCCALAGQN